MTKSENKNIVEMSEAWASTRCPLRSTDHDPSQPGRSLFGDPPMPHMSVTAACGGDQARVTA